MKTFSAFVLGIFSASAMAHCPAHYKEEKACFMLEGNKLYIYDEKVEHNGPYKDLKSTISVLDKKGTVLKTEKLARGLLNIHSNVAHKEVYLDLQWGKVSKKIFVKSE